MVFYHGEVAWVEAGSSKVKEEMIWAVDKKDKKVAMDIVAAVEEFEKASSRRGQPE